MVGGVAWSGNSETVPPGEWEADDIVGEEVIGGVRHYMVNWKPTLEPEGNLGNMRELIEKWERNKAGMGPREEQRKGGSGINRQGSAVRVRRTRVGKTGSTGARRGRGRPRKD